MTKTYTLEHAQKGVIQYTDKKRYWWLMSLFMPIFPLLSLWLYFRYGQEWLLAIPLVTSYTLFPLADHFIGMDENNPPEDIVPQLEDDRYYRWLTWATVPMHFIVLIAMAVFVGTQDLSMISVIVMAITAGTYSGLGINTAHELGHKKNLYRATTGKNSAGSACLWPFLCRTQLRPSPRCRNARRSSQRAHGPIHLPICITGNSRHLQARLAGREDASATHRQTHLEFR